LRFQKSIAADSSGNRSPIYALLDAPITRDDQRRLGTPTHRSREQEEVKLTDFRSDIYTLGLILHELIRTSP
jgi:serine/threonine protein kinase